MDKVTKGLTVTGVRGEYRPLDAAGNATGDWTVITQTGGFSYTTQTETDGTIITAYFDPQKIYGESYKVDSANNVSLVISCKVDETDPTKPECIFKEANNYTAETNVGDAVITTNYGPQVVVVKKASPTVTLHVPVTYHFVNRPEGTEELLPDPVNVTRGAAYTAVDTKTITKAGYVLKGWYTDEGCTAKYADGTTITTATPLYGIWEKTLADGTITTDECIYNGNEQTPENIVVKNAAGQVLKENQDYTLTVTSGTNAGEYAIVALGIGDYAGTTLEGTWEIKPKSIADMTALVDDTVYDATAKKPQVLLNDGLTLLKEGKDYQIVLKNGNTSETKAGVYGITVEGTGNYTDTISKEWEIGKRPAIVTADNKSKTVGEKDPKFTATITNLAEGDSIEVKFTRKEGEEAGKYRIEPTSDNTNYSMLFVPGTLTIKTKDGTLPVTGDEMRVYKMALAGVLATLFIIFGMKLFVDSHNKE